MEIICDKRETKVIAAIDDELHQNVRCEFLTIGDFILGYRARDILIPLVIVERKTWADLAASLKDGRSKNIQKLVAFREETGASIAYLIEGNVPRDLCIPQKNLRAHLDHLLFKEHIIELRTKSPEDSLRRLLEFAKNLEIFGEERARDKDGGTKDGVAAAKVKFTLSEAQIKNKIWASFEGISLTSAAAFRDYKIADLYCGKITAEDLAGVKIGASGRNFGGARAGALLAALSKEKTLEGILCALPGISTKRARQVLDCLAEGIEVRPINILFSDWANMGPQVEARIGKKAAKTLEQYLF